MDKKGKKKDKKGKGPKTVLSEVDRTFFSLIITDLEHKLIRQQEREVVLRSANKQLQLDIESLQEESQDMILYLKKMRIREAEKDKEAVQRLEGLSQTREAERIVYEEKMKKVEEDFQNMTAKLKSELASISLVLGKVEDFKENREKYMVELEVLAQKLKEKEEEHDLKITDINNKAVQDTIQATRESIERLWEMSSAFRKHKQEGKKYTDVRVMNETACMVHETEDLNEELEHARAEKEELKDEVNALQTQIRLLAEQNIRLCQQMCSNKERLPTLKVRYNELQAEIKKREEEEREVEATREATKVLNDQMSVDAEVLAPLSQRHMELSLEIEDLRKELIYENSMCDKLQLVIAEVSELLQDFIKKRTPDDTHALKLQEDALFRQLMFVMVAYRHPMAPQKEIAPIDLMALPYEDGALGLIPVECKAKTGSPVEKKKQSK